MLAITYSNGFLIAVILASIGLINLVFVTKIGVIPILA